MRVYKTAGISESIGTLTWSLAVVGTTPVLLFPRSVPLGAKQQKEVARSRHDCNHTYMPTAGLDCCTGRQHSLISFGYLRSYNYKLPGTAQVRVLVVPAEPTEPTCAAGMHVVAFGHWKELPDFLLNTANAHNNLMLLSRTIRTLTNVQQEVLHSGVLHLGTCSTCSVDTSVDQYSFSGK